MKKFVHYMMFITMVVQLFGCAILKDSAMKSLGLGAFNVSVRRHTDAQYPPTTEVRILTNRSQLPELYINLAEIIVSETISSKDLIGFLRRDEDLNVSIRDKIIERDIEKRAKKMGADAVLILSAKNYIRFSQRPSTMAFAPRYATDTYKNETSVVHVMAVKYNPVGK